MTVYLSVSTYRSCSTQYYSRGLERKEARPSFSFHRCHRLAGAPLDEWRSSVLPYGTDVTVLGQKIVLRCTLLINVACHTKETFMVRSWGIHETSMGQSWDIHGNSIEKWTVSSIKKNGRGLVISCCPRLGEICVCVCVFFPLFSFLLSWCGKRGRGVGVKEVVTNYEQ